MAMGSTLISSSSSHKFPWEWRHHFPLSKMMLLSIVLFCFVSESFGLIEEVEAKKKVQYASKETLKDLKEGIDTGYILISAILSFYIQAGYMMVEVGCVRVKNTKNVILKASINFCLCSLGFWATGYAIGFGNREDNAPLREQKSANPFIGTDQYFLQGLEDTSHHDLYFFFLTYLGAIPAVVSGALSERTHFSVYFIHTVFTALWIWPVLAHWVWGNGWLMQFGENGFLDFCGGGVVFTMAGTCALVGAVMAGPRLGRFIDGKPREITGYSNTLVALGLFILWFGWCGWAAGSSLGAVNGLAFVGSKAVANTSIAASFGGATALVYSLVVERDANLVWILHSIHCALVAISAGSGYIEPWAACVIGTGAVFMYRGSNWLLTFLRIDDPLDSIGVHLMGGIWGVLCTGCFATKDMIEKVQLKDNVSNYGLFLGGGGEVIGTQFLGLAVIIGWSTFWTVAVILPFKLLKSLRVDSDIEKKGLDVQGYGADSWGCVEIVDNGRVDEFQFRIQ